MMDHNSTFHSYSHVSESRANNIHVGAASYPSVQIASSPHDRKTSTPNVPSSVSSSSSQSMLVTSQVPPPRSASAPQSGLLQFIYIPPLTHDLQPRTTQSPAPRTYTPRNSESSVPSQLESRSPIQEQQHQMPGRDQHPRTLLGPHQTQTQPYPSPTQYFRPTSRGTPRPESHSQPQTFNPLGQYQVPSQPRRSDCPPSHIAHPVLHIQPQIRPQSRPHPELTLSDHPSIHIPPNPGPSHLSSSHLGQGPFHDRIPHLATSTLAPIQTLFNDAWKVLHSRVTSQLSEVCTHYQALLAREKCITEKTITASRQVEFERDSLREELARMKDTNKCLENDKENLSRESEDLKKEKHKLTIGNTRLRSEGKRLKEENAKLFDKCSSYQKEVQQMTEEWDIARALRMKLHQENEQLKKNRLMKPMAGDVAIKSEPDVCTMGEGTRAAEHCSGDPGSRSLISSALARLQDWGTKPSKADESHRVGHERSSAITTSPSSESMSATITPHFPVKRGSSEMMGLGRTLTKNGSANQAHKLQPPELIDLTSSGSPSLPAPILQPTSMDSRPATDSVQRTLMLLGLWSGDENREAEQGMEINGEDRPYKRTRVS